MEETHRGIAVATDIPVLGEAERRLMQRAPVDWSGTCDLPVPSQPIASRSRYRFPRHFKVVRDSALKLVAGLANDIQTLAIPVGTRPNAPVAPTAVVGFQYYLKRSALWRRGCHDPGFIGGWYFRASYGSPILCRDGLWHGSSPIPTTPGVRLDLLPAGLRMPSRLFASALFHFLSFETYH